jgi:hypothetical protein
MSADTAFVDFTSGQGSALRLLPGSYATLVSASFKRNKIVATEFWTEPPAVTGSAVAAINNSFVWISKVCYTCYTAPLSPLKLQMQGCDFFVPAQATHRPILWLLYTLHSLYKSWEKGLSNNAVVMRQGAYV